MHNGKSIAPHKSVEALAAELQSQGLSDLAADVTFGPIAVAARMTTTGNTKDSVVSRTATTEAKHSLDSSIDDCIEDVLDKSDDDDDTESDDDEDDDDSFDEVLDDDDEDAGEEDSVTEEDEDSESIAQSNPISSVILDPDRTYSKQELQTLRTVANTCIARKHLVPNAKALLKSLDAYESQH